MKKAYIGFDNGTGTYGIITPDFKEFGNIPVYPVPKYTAKKATIKAIDFEAVKEMILNLKEKYELVIAVENPSTNTKFGYGAFYSYFNYAVIDTLLRQHLKVPFQYIPAKRWQNKILGKVPKGKTKEYSLMIGKQLYPEFANHKAKDRDGILIAHYLKITDK